MGLILKFVFNLYPIEYTIKCGDELVGLESPYAPLFECN